MPARRRRSSGVWTGAALSALAHAGLIALALAALPWLRAPRARPVPVVAVTLVTPAALDAAMAAAARRDEEEAGTAEPAPVAVPAAPVAVAPVPEDPAAAPGLPTLAPAFDAQSPLGLGPAAADLPADLPAHRPRARPGEAAPVEAAPVAPAEAATAFAEAVRAAVIRQLAPEQPGPAGTVRLALIINREGRLLAARLVKPSGSPSLDRVASDAARTARLPEMPEAMPHARTIVEIDLVFAGSGG